MEHGTFFPLVFQQQMGWLTKQFFYKHLAFILSEKRNKHYAIVMDDAVCCFPFYYLLSGINVVIAPLLANLLMKTLLIRLMQRQGFLPYITNNIILCILLLLFLTFFFTVPYGLTIRLRIGNVDI